jgi:hypothetical protein
MSRTIPRINAPTLEKSSMYVRGRIPAKDIVTVEHKIIVSTSQTV